MDIHHELNYINTQGKGKDPRKYITAPAVVISGQQLA